MRKRANSMARRRSISRLHGVKAAQLAQTSHGAVSVFTDTYDFWRLDWSEGAVVVSHQFGSNP